MNRSSEFYPDGQYIERLNFRPQPFDQKVIEKNSSGIVKAPTARSEEELCRLRKEINKPFPPRMLINQPAPVGMNIQDDCVDTDGFGCCDNRESIADCKYGSERIGEVVACRLKK